MIYDVGLFDGSDTAYYLHRGFKVIAIDANPVMVDMARDRFSREVSAGRLTLINAGISEHGGEDLTFWSSDVPAWSSFNRDIASRNGTAHHAIKVPVVEFSDILTEHGVPYYLKIDIEGNDHLCVKPLSKIRKLPTYISVESECVGDHGIPSDEDVLEMLNWLAEAGYRKFKLLNQKARTAVRADPLLSLASRAIDSFAYGKLGALGLAPLAKRLTDSDRILRKTMHHFTIESSGPLSEEIPGPWMAYDDARKAYLRERRRYFTRSPNQPQSSFWYDWHATV